MSKVNYIIISYTESREEDIICVVENKADAYKIVSNQRKDPKYLSKLLANDYYEDIDADELCIESVRVVENLDV